MPRPFLCLMAVLLLAAPAAQAQRYQFKPYDGEDGLSQLVGQTMLQDQAGYMWIGTFAGLNRYDGQRFEVFGIAEGLTSDFILDLAQGPDGHLWVATAAGLARWDEGRFTVFTVADGLPGDHISTLEFDHAGTLWAGTDQGLARWNGAGFEPMAQAGLAQAPIHALVQGRQGRLWVATDQGLFYLHNNRLQRFALSQSPNLQVVYSLTEDDQGRVWLVRPDRVEAYAGGQRVVLLTAAEGLPRLHPQSPVFVDRYGVIWVGSRDGFAMIDGGVVKPVAESNGLPFHTGLSVTEDAHGVIWLGGYGGLVQFLGRGFTNYTIADGLGASDVRALARDRHGTLWAGSGNGLSRFDGQKWSNLTIADGLRGNQIIALTVGSQGCLWIGSSAGINCYRDGRIEQLPGSENLTNVYAVAEYPRDTLWLATAAGLVTWHDEVFTTIEVPGQVFDDNTRLLVDSKQRLWASGAQGLSRWDGRHWRTFGTADGLAYRYPYYLAEDLVGNLWFGYRASYGLTRYDGEGFTTYTTADGLTNNAVFSIGVDRDNSLWVGTARGVDHFDGERFINYGPLDGYASEESNAGGFLLDDDGTVWFGTAQGISHYDPALDQLRAEQTVRPALVDVRLGRHRLAPADNRMQVAHSDNDLLARVAPLAYLNPRHLSFRYRLSGDFDNWRELKGFVIQHTNLSAGEYRLEVAGRVNRGPWSAPATVDITVQAPYWKRWWFFALAALLLMTVIGLGYRWRVRHMAARASWLEGQVAHRTHQLENSKSLLESQKLDLENTLAELKQTREQLFNEAHKAGMADVAIGVLHNVGNVLNNINISAELMRETVRGSKLSGLVKANELLAQQRDDLSRFLLTGDKGQVLVDYYLQLEQSLRLEHLRLEQNSARLIEKIEVVKDVIATQQRFAGGLGLYEMVALDEVVDNALEIQAQTIRRHGIKVERAYAEVPPVVVQRGKLIDALAAAISNAQEAMVSIPINSRILRITIEADHAQVYIRLRDGGCGLNASQLQQAFNHGFTSKADGQGFGLHDAANFLAEMGGRVSLESDGLGQGATLTICLRRGSSEQTSSVLDGAEKNAERWQAAGGP